MCRKEKERERMASIVISDTHFGSSSSTLQDPGKVDQLMDEISGEERGFDEVVLLGDIFDFWRVRPEKAVRDSIYFLKRLAEMDSRILYVVGNHDHHLVVLNQEDEFMERMARGDIYPVYVPSLRWNQTIDGHSIEMHYPTYQTSCCQRTFLFTHGHHLNGIQAFSMQMVKRLRRISAGRCAKPPVSRSIAAKTPPRAPTSTSSTTRPRTPTFRACGSSG
jgi:predicted phosphodiesterase